MPLVAARQAGAQAALTLVVRTRAVARMAVAALPTAVRLIRPYLRDRQLLAMAEIRPYLRGLFGFPVHCRLIRAHLAYRLRLH